MEGLPFYLHLFYQNKKDYQPALSQYMVCARNTTLTPRPSHSLSSLPSSFLFPFYIISASLLPAVEDPRPQWLILLSLSLPDAVGWLTSSTPAHPHGSLATTWWHLRSMDQHLVFAFIFLPVVRVAQAPSQVLESRPIHWVTAHPHSASGSFLRTSYRQLGWQVHLYSHHTLGLP